jgi:NADPH:quinone reductase-like Zn-dependent oxidoreductase
METLCTVWSNVFLLAGLRAGETLLVHGGSSGIGTMAIQLGRQFGARVAVTASSAEKLEACEALGAEILIDYRTEDFVERIDAEGGADVVLDLVGGPYLDRNIRSLRPGGRIANIASAGGARAELDLGLLMQKRATVSSTSLRARPLAERVEIVASVGENVWPLVENGLVRPVTAARIPLADAAEAHRLMESSAHIGKILLTV